jgi:hypothetical protein
LWIRPSIVGVRSSIVGVDRSIAALNMPLEIGWVEIDFAEIPVRVALRLVEKMM